MSTIHIKNEAIQIYKELGVDSKSILLLCPILKILQMRDNSLDKTHAKQIVSDFLKN